MAFAELTLRSTVLEMDVKVDVMLPENRHNTVREDKKYPVLYILHGYKEDNSTWARLSNLPLLVRDLPLIVCTVSCYNGFYTNHTEGMQLNDWIAKELPVKLANYFPVSEKREDTYIMGESMGGYGTMRLALGHPEVYGHACVLSAGAMGSGNFYSNRGPMKKATAERIFGPEEEFENSDNNLLHLLKKVNDSEGPKPEMQFYCGTEDGGYPGVVKTVDFVKENCPNIPLINAEFWHGKHDFYFWNQAIPKALKGFGFDVENIDAAI